MLIDTCLYAGERDMLDLRMCELHDRVDLFVVVEGTLTFQGKPREVKRLPAQVNLTHIVVDDFPEASARNPWKREMWQRNAVLRGLAGLYDDDVIMLSDVDEIPDAELIPSYVAQGEFYRFHQQLYQFNFNNRVTNDRGSHLGWNNTTVCQLQDLRRLYPQGVRNLVDRVVIINGGWHFSYFVNPHDKLESFSHIELKDMEGTLQQRVKERWHYEYEFVEGIAHLPHCVQENVERYAKYFQPVTV